MWNVSGKVGPPELSGETRSESRKGHVCQVKSEIFSPVHMVHQRTIRGDGPISLHKNSNQFVQFNPRV